MSGKIQVSIDHRCDLGNYYSLAERSRILNAGARNVAHVPTPCFVRQDCGAIIEAGDRATIWYFTRRGDNNTIVGTLCSRCDAEMIEVAVSEVNA